MSTLTKSNRAIIAQLQRAAQHTRRAPAPATCVPLADAHWVTLHPTLGMIGAYVGKHTALSVAREFGGYAVVANGFHNAKRRDAAQRGY